ncbi:terpenoid synthase [Crepidotus variabilis]|uniref:Terpene synthase n=1 Tax=Crepidotus variabilis TaxID=179855 RepID=A0A9P6EL44_9AGAR|nr:terpenoid synthase [Crepidotus variabilis]
MNPSTLTFTLPDLLARFPWPRNLSEFYTEAKAESSTWTEGFHPFDEDGLEGFNLCDFNLLAGLAYAPREKEIIRLGCDLMNIFYVFDEYSDITDAAGAEGIRNIIMDAFRNPHNSRPEGELLLGEMCRDFWLRASSYVKPDAHCLGHFLRDFDLYTEAVVREADDRTKRIYRSFEEYLAIRRDSSGCYPSFALCEFGLDLPEEAYHHPRMAELRVQATDLIAIGNDIDSYAMEKARGLELHNSVELVMKEQGVNVQGAINWLERYAAGVHAGFLENVAQMPSWGEQTDKKVKTYIDGLAQWIRGNDDWTFESGRYFGSKGLEIQKTRVMTLLPPSRGYVKKSA